MRTSLYPEKRRPVQAVLVTDRRGRWIVEHYHAKRAATVELPASDEPPITVTAGPGSSKGPKQLPEYVAAEVDFPTVEALCSLVTRHAGHVAVASPPEVVHSVEQWINNSLLTDTTHQ